MQKQNKKIESWSTVSQQLLMGVAMWSSRDPISKQVPVTSVFFTFCGQTHLAQMRYHFLAITHWHSQTANQDERQNRASWPIYVWGREQVAKWASVRCHFSRKISSHDASNMHLDDLATRNCLAHRVVYLLRVNMCVTYVLISQL